MDSPAEASPRLKDEDVDYEELAPVNIASVHTSTTKTPTVSGNEADSLVRKWKGGEVVNLRGMDGEEMAVGVVTQATGAWQGLNLEDQNLCLVQVSDLKVDKATKLPFPFPPTGSSFEEAETLVGKPRVAWDVNHMHLVVAAPTTPPPPPLPPLLTQNYTPTF